MTTNTKPYWTIDVATREVISGPHVSQFRGGIWHIPNNAITVKPLPAKAGFAVLALEDGSGTQYVDDHRGKTVYDKQTQQQQEVTELGPLSDSLTELAPEPDDVWSSAGWELDPAAIDRHRLHKHADINAWRSLQERENLVFDHAGRSWDGDIDSKARMNETLALTRAMGTLPNGFFWTSADDVDVPMTLLEVEALAEALYAARGQRGFEIHARQRTMKSEVDALAETASIEAVKAYTAGW